MFVKSSIHYTLKWNDFLSLKNNFVKLSLLWIFEIWILKWQHIGHSRSKTIFHPTLLNTTIFHPTLLNTTIFHPTLLGTTAKNNPCVSAVWWANIMSIGSGSATCPGFAPRITKDPWELLSNHELQKIMQNISVKEKKKI